MNPHQLNALKAYVEAVVEDRMHSEGPANPLSKHKAEEVLDAAFAAPPVPSVVIDAAHEVLDRALAPRSATHKGLVGRIEELYEKHKLVVIENIKLRERLKQIANRAIGTLQEHKDSINR